MGRSYAGQSFVRYVMQQSLKQTAHQSRAILADVSTAEIHPSSMELAPGARLEKRIMHAINVALLSSGRLANRAYERKIPHWPLRGEAISVLGYGVEKVAYRVRDSHGRGDSVVSVFHLASLVKSPQEVIDIKRQKYQTYCKYFGDLVVPTLFVILDNPWGDGGKPASIQPYIENTQKFANFTQTELTQRAERDAKFAKNLDYLVNGYQNMSADGIYPDFASSNLLVSGSNIVIFDTGGICSVQKAAKQARLHPNYRLIEALANA